MSDPSSLDAFADIPAEAVWLRPLGLLRGSAAVTAIAQNIALPLAGGPTAFMLVEVLALRDRRLVSAVASLAAVRAWSASKAPAITDQLARLAAPRPPWAGLSLDRP